MAKKKGRHIFISYKYDDGYVHGRGTTARDYVDALQELLEDANHVYKGEPDGVDLSQRDDDTIRKILADRMFYTSVTIVLISPNMKENRPEREQWIPWEVSYSLRTENREAGKSYPNAMIAVVLPDANNSYKYYLEENICSSCNARRLKTGTLFPILRDNMFNPHDPEYSDCICDQPGARIYTGESSYIHSVKWCDFMDDSQNHIERALERQRNRDDYELHKTLR